MNGAEMWERNLPDGTTLQGFKGSDVHVHEIGFGAGVVTIQSTGEHVPFGNFVRDVDELLPLEWRIDQS